MKRCPTCNKTFTELNLSYCVDDGTPLISVYDDDDELTEVGKGSGTPPAYQPPSYPQAGSEQRRRTWPWVVGIIGLLVLALAGFTIAGMLLIPRIVKKSAPIVSNSNSNTESNSNQGANHNSNSESDNSAESKASSESNLSSPPPTDKEVVLAQLKDLEHEWTVANLNADKKKLGQILADDYVGAGSGGKMQGKSEYINTVERDTHVKRWEFEDLRLTVRGDRATLLGKIHYELEDREVVFDFVDRFVWRDSRWQATGSEVTQNQ